MSNLRPVHRTALPAALAFVILSGLACSGGAPSPQGGRPAVAVSAATVERRDVPLVISAVGSVEPITSVSVRSQVSGEILAVDFEEGQEVARGAVLFRIDPRPYRAALLKAEATLARDQAQVAGPVAQARRYQELLQKDYVTPQDAENAQAAAEAARATVRADSAAAESARLDLDHTTIRAPVSGRTGSLLVQRGNLVSPGGAALVVINQIAPIYVSFSVPEQDLPRLRRASSSALLAVAGRSDRPDAPSDPGIPVEASFPADSARVFRGTLSFINNAVDEATGTVLLKATFPNPDHALWPGQFVNVAVHLGELADTLVVPSVAIEPGQEGDYVWLILPGGTVTMRSVRTGVQNDGWTVVAAGLAAGDSVVTDGQLRLTPGARVAVKPAVGSGPGSGRP